MKQSLDWQTKEMVEIYDEVPLWSAPFGKILLDNIPMQANWTIVDLGFGTGFPLIELAQRFGDGSQIIGVDIWEAAMQRVQKKIERLELSNIKLINQKASDVFIQNSSVDLVCSNIGVNNFENKESVYSKVHKMLKAKGHFCLTTNDQRTFEELFILFEDAFLKLDLNLESLRNYINSRSNSEQLIEQIGKNGFEQIKQIEETTYLRFVSSKALFNHSLIRIAFLTSWQSIIPKEKWISFLKLVTNSIEAIISNKGEFKMTIPMVYLNFVKK